MNISVKNKQIILLIVLAIALIAVALFVPRISKALTIESLYGKPRLLTITSAPADRNDPYTLGQISGLCMSDAIYITVYNGINNETVWCKDIRIKNGLEPYAPYTEALVEKAKVAAVEK